MRAAELVRRPVSWAEEVPTALRGAVCPYNESWRTEKPRSISDFRESQSVPVEDSCEVRTMLGKELVSGQRGCLGSLRAGRCSICWGWAGEKSALSTAC